MSNWIPKVLKRIWGVPNLLDIESFQEQQLGKSSTFHFLTTMFKCTVRRWIGLILFWKLKEASSSFSSLPVLSVKTFGTSPSVHTLVSYWWWCLCIIYMEFTVLREPLFEATIWTYNVAVIAEKVTTKYYIIDSKLNKWFLYVKYKQN